MSLTVETGAGLTNAESYLSVTDCDAYVTRFDPSSAWLDATTPNKEAALRRATQYLDGRYSFRGIRKTATQSLSWPRLSVYDDSNYLISDSTIPQKLKDATAELATRSLTETLSPDSSSPGIKKEAVSVGSISESVEYIGVKSEQHVYRVVDRLLTELINSPNRVERG